MSRRDRVKPRGKGARAVERPSQAAAGPRLDISGAHRRRLWFAISGVLVVICLVSLLARGLNLGIDFTGGVLFDLRFSRSVSTSEVRDALEGHGLGTSVITRDVMNPNAVIVRTKALTEGQRQEVLDSLGSEVAEVVSEDVRMVSPVIAGELIRVALVALAIASAAMIAYITYRFEFKFAIAAIVALLHDAFITIGAFSILGVEVSSAFVAAVLLIVGYSINDTIVVFDKIRENLKYRRREGFHEVVDASIRQTIVRSINTSLTTLLVVAALYLFGGRTTQGFALAMLIGITAGTYSSLFIASPLWVAWKEREQQPAGRPAGAAR